MKKSVKVLISAVCLIVTILLIVTFVENKINVGRFSMKDVLYIDGDMRYEDLITWFSTNESFNPTYVREILQKAGYEFTTNELALGQTDNPRDAIKKAEMVWIEVYGKKHTKGYKPYKIYYDSIGEVWLVKGSLRGRWYHKVVDHFFGEWLGGEPYILIQKEDGKTLTVWHDR